MMANRNQKAVENQLRDAMKIDRARIQTSRISRFGLLEMSRQRLRPSLGDATQLTCPRCKGQGSIRNIESVALSVLRIVEEEAMKKGTEKVVAHLPIECATFLLNEKRAVLQELETQHKVAVVVLPSRHLETPAYDIERIKSAEAEDDKPSHLQIKAESIAVPDFARKATHNTEKPAIKEFLPDMPAPAHNTKSSASLIQRFWQKLVGTSEQEASTTTTKKPASTQAKRTEDKPRDNRNKNRNNRNRNNEGEGRSKQNRHPRKNSGNRQSQKNTATEKKVNSPENVKTQATENDSATPEQKTTGQKQNTRRSPNNRRRSRNPNYKKPEQNQQNQNQQAVEKTNETAKSVDNPRAETQESKPKQFEKPRSYANKFAERSKQPERTEQAAEKPVTKPAVEKTELKTQVKPATEQAEVKAKVTNDSES